MKYLPTHHIWILILLVFLPSLAFTQNSKLNFYGSIGGAIIPSNSLNERIDPKFEELSSIGLNMAGWAEFDFNKFSLSLETNFSRIASSNSVGSLELRSVTDVLGFSMGSISIAESIKLDLVFRGGINNVFLKMTKNKVAPVPNMSQFDFSSSSSGIFEKEHDLLVGIRANVYKSDFDRYLIGLTAHFDVIVMANNNTWEYQGGDTNVSNPSIPYNFGLGIMIGTK